MALGDRNNPVFVVQDELPDDVAVVDGSTGAADTVTATVAAAADERAYLDKVIVSGLGATAAGSTVLTIAGAEGEDVTVTLPVPAGATVALTPFVLSFDPPLRGAALGDDITASTSTFGVGNTSARVMAFGHTRAD